MAQTPPAPAVNPAQTYEDVMVRYVFGPLAEETIRITGPKAGDRVLDVAAGTGIVIRQIANLIEDPGRLEALDMSPAMLAHGRSLADADGASVEWHEGLADQLPYDDGAFDWVYCQHGLQFFKDKVAALREMRRVLDSSGKAVITVWQSLERHRYFHVIDNIAFEHAGIHMFKDPFSLGSPDDLRSLLEEAGFREVSIEPVALRMQAPEPDKNARGQLIAATLGIPSLRELSEAKKTDLIDGVMASASAIIDEHTVDGMLTVDWHANLAIAGN